MAEDNIVALRVVLDRGGEGQPSEFRQMSALCWGPEAKLAQLMESLSRGHALILF